MAEERTPKDASSAEATSPDEADVEAHGAKEVMSVGLAAVAFLGTGSAAKAYEGSQADQQGIAFVNYEADIKAIDRDSDGYASVDEILTAGYKVNVDGLNVPGIDVGVEDLAAAQYKVHLDLLGGDGFAIELDTIMLKDGLDPNLDAIVERWGADWPSKLPNIDLDGDGYAGVKELAGHGYTLGVEGLVAAGHEVTVDRLDEAGYKVSLDVLGDGGFVTVLDTIMLKDGVDPNLDAILEGQSVEWPSKL